MLQIRISTEIKEDLCYKKNYSTLCQLNRFNAKCTGVGVLTYSSVWREGKEFSGITWALNSLISFNNSSSKSKRELWWVSYFWKTTTRRNEKRLNTFIYLNTVGHPHDGTTTILYIQSETRRSCDHHYHLRYKQLNENRSEEGNILNSFF